MPKYTVAERKKRFMYLVRTRKQRDAWKAKYERVRDELRDYKEGCFPCPVDLDYEECKALYSLVGVSKLPTGVRVRLLDNVMARIKELRAGQEEKEDAVEEEEHEVTSEDSVEDIKHFLKVG